MNLSRLGPFFFFLLVPCPILSQWTQQPFPSSEHLWKVRFANPTTGWIVGSDFVYRTTDAGATWIAQVSSLGATFALCALDSTTAFYSPYTRGIRRTSDGGSTWQTVDSTTIYYTDFEIVTQQVIYAAGATVPDNEPILRKTTDGGVTWFTVSTIAPGSIYGDIEGISFLDEMQGWAIAYRGTIYHTTDGGLNWAVQDSSATVSSMRDIQFTTPDSGWAVGGIGGFMTIMRTTDGGSAWITSVSQCGSSLREIQMLNSQLGWIAGIINCSPYIARTTDGGETWETQEENSGFESFDMMSSDEGVAVGYNFHKTTNGGVTGVPTGAEVPTAFSLLQNYPNPFNPTTVITYGLPERSHVRIDIFNLLGQSVALLVDAEQNAGYRSVVLESRGLASGMYFYRLSTTNFVQTKKLVVLR